MSTPSRAAFGAALAGLLLASSACSGPPSPAAVAAPLPAHQVLANGLDVRVDDVSPALVNTDGSQQYVATYTVSDPDGEPLTFRKNTQVLFADGKQYRPDTEATSEISHSGLLLFLNSGASRQTKVVFDLPAGAKVTGAGVGVDYGHWRINLAS